MKNNVRNVNNRFSASLNSELYQTPSGFRKTMLSSGSKLSFPSAGGFQPPGPNKFRISSFIQVNTYSQHRFPKPLQPPPTVGRQRC